MVYLEIASCRKMQFLHENFWFFLTPLCTQVLRLFWSNFHAFVYVTLCVCCVISSQITADTHVTYWNLAIIVKDTGKSLSEALTFASTNPQYDDKLFIVHENCKLRIPAEHVVYTNCCFCFVLTFRTILVHNMFSRCCELLKKIYLYR